MAVSVQQASTNAFVAYLQSQLPDVAVSSRWPGKTLLSKAITVLPAGHRQDTPIEPRVLSKTNQGNTQTSVVWQIAACYQPYQLDVWCLSHVDRDDLLARLDRILRVGTSSLPNAANRDPIGHGCSIAVLDGWDTVGTIAKFRFTDPDVSDTPDSISRSQFRALLRGGANVMLTITAISPRQKTIKLSLLLDGEITPTEYLA